MISRDIDKYVGNLSSDNGTQEYHLICVVKNKQNKMKILDNKKHKLGGIIRV